ncbi:MAG: NDP-sugar synthase [Acidobacteria bacterium]|nr:NDP-sugar synthase [Acidobacteriota bacterium]MCA1642792.1 NDP-sugar synthase [Acidobacteriota bacterium]
MRAMILAAGYGTRLWPLTIDRAKPALPFMGRPLVGYVAEYLAREGFSEVAVNLHHRPESVRAALGDGSRFGVRLTYVEEPVILGTGGALDNARDFFAHDEPFAVINGKLATDIDLGAALRTHREAGALATLVLRPNPAREKYSTVDVRDGLVRGFGAHPQKSDDAGGAGEAGTPLMFTGIQILEPRIFEFIPRGVFSHTTSEAYPHAIERGEKIAAHVARGKWYELSTIERYLDTSVALMREANRSVEMGAGSRVEDGGEVSDAVLWEGVRVERGARVRRAVLGAGVTARGGDDFEDVAVVRAELVRGSERPEKAHAGETRGDNFVVKLPR